MSGRFSYLFASLLLLFILYPFFADGSMASVVWNLVFSAIVLSSIYTERSNRRRLIFALCLGLPILMLRWLDLFLQYQILPLTTNGLGLPFFVFITINTLSRVLKAKQVTADTLLGAASIYLLLGLTWAALFSSMERLHPGSFSIPASQSDWSDFIFYSFTTLTTLGYGDITPVSPAARSFAVLEAITGVFYVAVLVARLVGLLTWAENKPE
jgi:hypothetical protein